LVEEVRGSAEFADLPTIMLTSGGQRGDGQRCSELGIAAYLIKPVLQSELLDAILSVLGTHAATPQPAAPTRPASHQITGTALRVLLAEDNAINRRLAIRILEKRGHTVLAVDDGVKALAALEQGHFDVVLMDVQMPSMDGIEATAAIRKKEGATGRHVPIVAMTAHAMSGDRQRLLMCGMDGYVSKPVHQEDLFEAIEEVLSRGAHVRSS
jgi:two-component system sensor histidine kinase/response regulator